MRELEYPFDADELLLKKKKIKRKLLQQTDHFIKKNVAVLGGATTHGIVEILDLFLLNHGIQASFYESGFQRFYEDAVFGNITLEEFAPDIIYICTSNRNVSSCPSLNDSIHDIEQKLEIEIHKFNKMWDSLYSRFGCPIIQNNFEMPFYRILGNKDISDIHGRGNFLARLNMEFYQYAQVHENFYICDIQYLSADYGLKEWSDPFYYYMYKYALNVKAIPQLAFHVANVIKSVFGKNKKGFVLDLDQTLWGGVIGERGAENVKLGPEEPEGQAYLEFQSYVKEHLQLGVILAIDSKNDMENALAGLRHPDSILTENDFVVIKANWEPKDQNFSRIAEELQLLPESLVFVDDNPAERHIVTGQLPGVAAPQIGKVHQYIQNLDRAGFFETTVLSADDRNRNNMYRENVQRLRTQAEFKDYKDYLRSLEMKAVIRPFESVYMARIAQLSNKSNQFNLTTHRYTQTEIEALAADTSYITLYGKLADRFGDNGVVSVIIGQVEEDRCRIELWIMSCRVLKREMEYAMMDVLVQKCSERGINKIYGYYYPTAKNNMVRNFYADMGFEKISEDSKGNTEWIYQMQKDDRNKNTVIQIETCEDK